MCWRGRGSCCPARQRGPLPLTALFPQPLTRLAIITFLFRPQFEPSHTRCSCPKFPPTRTFLPSSGILPDEFHSKLNQIPFAAATADTVTRVSSRQESIDDRTFQAAHHPPPVPQPTQHNETPLSRSPSFPKKRNLSSSWKIRSPPISVSRGMLLA